MSLDYRIWCRRAPKESDIEWEGGLGEAVAYWAIWEPDDFERELAEQFDCDFAFAIGLNCPSANGEFGDEMARLAAKTTCGAAWLDHAGWSSPLFDYTEYPNPDLPFSLHDLRSEWWSNVLPEIEKKQRAFDEKEKRRAELREKAQNGELADEWGDLDPDDFS